MAAHEWKEYALSDATTELSQHDEIVRNWPLRTPELPPPPQVPYAGQHWD